MQKPQILKTIPLELKRNCHLIGNTLFSFETPVAKLVKGNFVSLGKFSRTTGQHTIHAAHLLGAGFVENKTKRTDFTWLPRGCKTSFGAAINDHGSKAILSGIKAGLGEADAIASAWKILRKKDRALILSKIADQPKFLELVKMHSRLQELELCENN